MERIEDKQRVTRLLLLFLATYLVSNLPRVNYAAVVTEIADAEGMLRSVASLALTGSAVTYGVGQLLSGWLGDRILPRTLVFGGLLTGGVRIETDGMTWLCILGLALPATALSNMTLVKAIKRLGPPLT